MYGHFTVSQVTVYFIFYLHYQVLYRYRIVDYTQFFLICESKVDNEVNSAYRVLDSKIPAELSKLTSISSTTVEKNFQRLGYYSFSLLDVKHYVSCPKYPFVDISGKSTYLSRTLVSIDYLGCFSEGANLNKYAFILTDYKL